MNAEGCKNMIRNLMRGRRVRCYLDKRSRGVLTEARGGDSLWASSRQT